jgi:pimeloyl-ACP methyl ester carboxylesterase
MNPPPRGSPIPMRTLVHANGVQLCAELFGNPTDPALVLMHGAGDTMLAWDEALCARLAADGRFVVRYDSRNAGRSTPRPPARLDDLAADARGLLDALRLERAHLLGMSLAAMAAQRLALDHPERVSALTLASTTPGGPGLPGMAPALQECFAHEPPAPDWSVRAAVVDWLVEQHRPFSARFDEPAARELARRVFEHSPHLERNLAPADLDMGEPRQPRLGEIAVPTLVVHGAEDPLYPPAHGRALAAAIPGARLLVLERTGHEPFPPDTWDQVMAQLPR